MVVAAPEVARTTWTAVPLEGLAGGAPLPFPLYLRTAGNSWVLYRDAATALSEDHLGRLHAEGTRILYVRDQDRSAYFQRVEHAVDTILLNGHMPLERRAEVLRGVAVQVAEDLMTARPTRDSVQRAQRVMMATSSLILREGQGFQAVRRVLGASHSLATHSLTTGFLAMGLARVTLGGEPTVLVTAGLAGLLHDVGKIGYEGLDHDPEHTLRGAEQLRKLHLPAGIVEAALGHHERWDGTGYPLGLVGPQIPEMARIVGLVNTFDKIYSAQQPRVGVYDALRILAQAYRGCFDDKLALGFVRMFG